MKKYLVLLTAFLTFFLVVSPASAQEMEYVWVNSIDTWNESEEIYLHKGETMHVKVTSKSGTAIYRVTDRFGNLITGGTVSPSTPKAYPKGAPEGWYKMILYCQTDWACQAEGRISDY